MSLLKRWVAICALTVIYGAGALISKLRAFPLFRGPERDGPIMLIGTFHNPNWVWAHVEPIARCGAAPVILVADEPIEGIPNVSNMIPPRWLQIILTRAGAKFIWSIYAALKHKPSMCMGYHVFPAGVIALVAGTLSGARTSFQVTAGPLELEGGGWHAENALLVALQRDSAIVEKAVMWMCRQFDLLVVRGREAEAFLRSHGCEQRIERITGSVVYPEGIDEAVERDIDILFVARLAEYKRPDRFVEAVAGVVEVIPEAKAVMLGDGPDRHALEQQICDLGLSDNISLLGQRSDVEDFQARARLMVLTSRWEGVSIAMLEAMARGVVPVVSDVGDLRDFVTEETGALLNEHDVEGFSKAMIGLLSDDAHWRRCSENARALVGSTSSKRAVQNRWFQVFSDFQANSPTNASTAST